MKIFSVFDPEFVPYGRIVPGLEDAVAQILPVLQTIPADAHVQYVASYPALQNLPAADLLRDHCFGGMPTQLGWCSGFNRKLNCLEYHRNSEFNLAPEDFILLLARQEEIEAGRLDTSHVKAFRVPAKSLVEVYATTLHYAPCHCDTEKGFRTLVALPWATNTQKPDIPEKNFEDKLLLAKNKWLLAHPDSDEASQGAYVGLTGANITLSDDL